MSETTPETEEQVVARHKKEARDLVATITGMKKQATKSKKKEVMRKCQEMEENMKTRHTQELALFQDKGEQGEFEAEEEEEITPAMLLAKMNISQEPLETKSEPAPVEVQPKKKRNRLKERLARRDAAMLEARLQAESEASEQPDLRAIEMANIEQLCNRNNLVQHDITPDGHCLFASILDQLKVRHEIEVSVQELRTKAANHIRNDPDTFAPFLFDENTLTMRDITSYTEEIEKTALWGGDMEIMALAKEFNCPISVMISGAAPLKINEDGLQPELKLVYYKNSFGLGEHYNSLRDK